MNQTEGILSFSINLPEMKIGIGFFYLRKENGGGFLINVIVSSVDNSNLPVVCRYCRLIFFFLPMSRPSGIYKCVCNLIQQKLSTYCKRFRFDSCWRKSACSVHSFWLSHMASSLLEDSSRNESDFKDTDQR